MANKAMGKKLETTPRGKVKNALRKLWLQSRERSRRLKEDKYTCQCCGVKQSTAKGKEQKVHVHHKNGIDWDGVVDLIFERLLVHWDELETLCIDCHKKEGAHDLLQSNKFKK